MEDYLVYLDELNNNNEFLLESKKDTLAKFDLNIHFGVFVKA